MDIDHILLGFAKYLEEEGKYDNFGLRDHIDFVRHIKPIVKFNAFSLAN